MLCQECGKRQASVHIKRVMDGNVDEAHLCTQCAREKGELLSQDPTAILQTFLPGLAGVPFGHAPDQHRTETCPSCGFSYQTFLQTGRLGCPDCYRSFAQPLEPLIRRLQGRAAHVGKMPARRSGTLLRQRKRDELRVELHKLVAAERYEEAATVRDQIREIEAEPGGDDDVHP